MQKVWMIAKLRNELENATQMRNRVSRRFERGDRAANTSQLHSDANNVMPALITTFKTRAPPGRTRSVNPLDTRKTQSVVAAVHTIIVTEKSTPAVKDKNLWSLELPLH